MSLDNRAAAYGFFPPDSQLENVFRALNHAGFENADLCVLLTSEHPIAERIRNWKAHVPHESFRDAAPERVIAWLATYGAVVISDVGIFVGSSDFLRALALPEELLSADADAGVFGVLGIPQAEAVRYNSRLRENAAFILVSCDHVAHSEWARELLSAMGGEEVSLLESRYQSLGETKTDPPRIN